MDLFILLAEMSGLICGISYNNHKALHHYPHQDADVLYYALRLRLRPVVL